MLSIDERQML